jgi:hypothetical protein
LAELVVITAGVLIALGADRWNEERGLAESRDIYIQRLAEDIRIDSAEAARVVADLPRARAARDLFMEAVAGRAFLPDDLSVLRRSSFERYNWVTPVAWTELNNTGLLGLVDDLELRRAVSAYYAKRLRHKTYLDGAELRGRDPYIAALYQIGWMDGEINLSKSERFVRWPEMQSLLHGLGGHFSLLETFAPLMEENKELLLSRDGL